MPLPYTGYYSCTIRSLPYSVIFTHSLLSTEIRYKTAKPGTEALHYSSSDLWRLPFFLCCSFNLVYILPITPCWILTQLADFDHPVRPSPIPTTYCEDLLSPELPGDTLVFLLIALSCSAFHQGSLKYFVNCVLKVIDSVLLIFVSSVKNHLRDFAIIGACSVFL